MAERAESGFRQRVRGREGGAERDEKGLEEKWGEPCKTPGRRECEREREQRELDDEEGDDDAAELRAQEPPTFAERKTRRDETGHDGEIRGRRGEELQRTRAIPELDRALRLGRFAEALEDRRTDEHGVSGAVTARKLVGAKLRGIDRDQEHQGSPGRKTWRDQIDNVDIVLSRVRACSAASGFVERDARAYQENVIVGHGRVVRRDLRKRAGAAPEAKAVGQPNGGDRPTHAGPPLHDVAGGPRARPAHPPPS